ncbi:hypothetical protein ASE63_10940 [Bosea sp. Root381]|uniref:hypothetical protein n=1 Tax=Bosea sp. Root381 TaxID=1736524 RepID=UPI0006F3CF43|nr:hypothetical protein [Bosea sp. Root381]KRE00004.1 hypothetical protein ASE63_10940 [Bosea sp. Root381]
MMVGLCVCIFIAGFMTGDYIGEQRWKRAAFEGLDLAAKAAEKLRGGSRSNDPYGSVTSCTQEGRIIDGRTIGSA